MELLTNIVIGEPDEEEAIGASEYPVEEWQGFEPNGLGPEKLAALHAVLTGESDDEAFAEYDHMHAATEEGPWVMRLPQELVEKLAMLDMDEETLQAVAQELAATVDFEEDGWDLDGTQSILEELVDFARICVNQGKALFLWMGL